MFFPLSEFSSQTLALALHAGPIMPFIEAANAAASAFDMRTMAEDVVRNGQFIPFHESGHVPHRSIG